MKQQLYIITLLLFTSVTCFAQNDKQILLEDIFTERKFSQDWVWGLNSMNDGLHYTIINRRYFVHVHTLFSLPSWARCICGLCRCILNSGSFELRSCRFRHHIGSSRC